MNYLKFYNGGNVVKKLEGGGSIDDELALIMLQNPKMTEEEAITEYRKRHPLESIEYLSPRQLGFGDGGQGRVIPNTTKLEYDSKTGALSGGTVLSTYADGTNKTHDIQSIQNNSSGAANTIGSNGTPFGMIGGAAVLAHNAVDDAVLEGKNFSLQSKAIDSATDKAASVASLFGPWGLLAAGAIKTGNSATKYLGDTTSGYDAAIKSSGYGNLSHKEASSSRDFGAAIGFGGVFNSSSIINRLKKRNEEAQMALKAANIADTIQFEQEARMNSVDDVIQQNEIALQGGIDTSLLAAKHGARLERIQKQRKRVNPDPEEVIVHENVIIETPEEVIIDAPVVKAQNGAKLEHIEVSEELNVIPSGAMHKNKNHIDLEITEKGIPVITVEDDSVETFEEIKEQEDTLVQHAEVEEAEIIFNKELTIFVENLRKQWHEKDNKDDSICLEAGMRLAKEIIENTEDNTDVTEKSMEAVDNEEN